MDQARPSGSAFSGVPPGNGAPERGRVVTRVTKCAHAHEIIETLHVPPRLDASSTMREIPNGPRDISTIFSHRSAAHDHAPARAASQPENAVSNADSQTGGAPSEVFQGRVGV